MASALKLITKEPDATPVRLTSVEPLRSKKPRGDFDSKRRGSNDRGGRSDKGRSFDRDRKRSPKRPSGERTR